MNPSHVVDSGVSLRFAGALHAHVIPSRAVDSHVVKPQMNETSASNFGLAYRSYRYPDTG